MYYNPIRFTVAQQHRFITLLSWLLTDNVSSSYAYITAIVCSFMHQCVCVIDCLYTHTHKHDKYAQSNLIVHSACMIVLHRSLSAYISVVS